MKKSISKNRLQTPPNELIIFQGKDGGIEFKSDVSKETIWANQNQIAILYGIDRSVVARHIINIIKDNEIDYKSNVQVLHIANSDKPVSFYNLDIILTVGYRTNSKIFFLKMNWLNIQLLQNMQQLPVMEKHTM